MTSIITRKIRNKMLNPQKVAAKIVEMIFDTTIYKNGDSAELYYPYQSLKGNTGGGKKTEDNLSLDLSAIFEK